MHSDPIVILPGVTFQSEFVSPLLLYHKQLTPEGLAEKICSAMMPNSVTIIYIFIYKLINKLMYLFIVLLMFEEAVHL